MCVVWVVSWKRNKLFCLGICGDRYGVVIKERWAEPLHTVLIKRYFCNIGSFPSSRNGNPWAIFIYNDELMCQNSRVIMIVLNVLNNVTAEQQLTLCVLKRFMVYICECYYHAYRYFFIKSFFIMKWTSNSCFNSWITHTLGSEPNDTLIVSVIFKCYFF